MSFSTWSAVTYLTRNAAAAALEGRIALIATQGGAKAELDLRLLMSKRLTLSASTLRPQSVETKGRLAQALRQNVWPLFATRAPEARDPRALPAERCRRRAQADGVGCAHRQDRALT